MQNNTFSSFSLFSPMFNQNRIAAKITIYIIIFGTIVAFITTALQVRREYKYRENAIINQIKYINEAASDSIAKTLSPINKKILMSQLRGILSLPNMKSVAVTDKKGMEYKLEKGSDIAPESLIRAEFPLIHTLEGKQITLGMLKLSAHTDNIKDEIYNQAKFVLLLIFLRTLGISVFIIYIVKHFLTRHIEKIAKYILKINHTNELKPLKLDRKDNPPSKQDELDLLTKSLTKLQKEQHESWKMRDEFLATAAHELKTPLTVIKGNIELLSVLSKQKDPLDLRQKLSIINRQCDNLNNIIEGLLEITNVTQNKRVPFFCKTSMKALILSIVDEMSSYSKNHKIIGSSMDDIEISIDRKIISQTLINVLTNAINYSPDGGIVEVSGKLFEDHYTISISDQGIGIPEEDSNKIFEKFFRGDKVSSGMGLGLYISKEHIRQHGGSIWYSHNPDKGTTFHISLSLNGASE